jgi:hypothetical protein
MSVPAATGTQCLGKGERANQKRFNGSESLHKVARSTFPLWRSPQIQVVAACCGDDPLSVTARRCAGNNSSLVRGTARCFPSPLALASIRCLRGLPSSGMMWSERHNGRSSPSNVYVNNAKFCTQLLHTFVCRGDEWSARSVVLFLFHARGDSPRFKFVAAVPEHTHVTPNK